MDKRDLIISLIHSNGRPIVGTTRLQKLLFITKQEARIDVEDDKLKFEPYKYGPVSKELYDDLEFLVNIGFIKKSKDSSEFKQFNINDIEKYSAKDFLSDASLNLDSLKIDSMNDGIDENNKSETIEDSIVYKITEEGIKYINENNLANSVDYNKIMEVNSKYGKYSLNSLLQYVYRKYPEYTTESDIKDDII